MSAWAKPGVKCVCVNAEGTNYLGITELVADGIYTLRWVGDEGGVAVCRIVEVLPRNRAGSDAPLALERFRPLITCTQEQDLKHFLPLLNSVKEPA